MNIKINLAEIILITYGCSVVLFLIAGWCFYAACQKYYGDDEKMDFVDVMIGLVPVVNLVIALVMIKELVIEFVINNQNNKS